MARQYRAFHRAFFASQPSNSLGGIGDLAVYRDPEGSSEILTKEQFLTRYAFEPTEEYLVGAPAYNTPIAPSDAKTGVSSLPFMQPEIFAGENKIIEEKAAENEKARIASSAPFYLSPFFALKFKGDPIQDSGVVPPGMMPTPSIPGAPVVVVGKPLPPPVPPDQGKCCIPVCERECKTMDTGATPSAVAYGGSSSSVAYGGQSIVQIGSPGAQAVAPEGSSMLAPPTPTRLAALASDGSEDTGGVRGLLAMIQPQTTADWWKLGVGLLAGAVITRWWTRQR